jgi:hypothetical protein
MPCPYSNILGIPGQGFHSTRIFGLSLYDILATIVLSVIVSYFFKVSFLKSFIGWFILGEILHYLFGSNTAFLQMIGVKRDCS